MNKKFLPSRLNFKLSLRFLLLVCLLLKSSFLTSCASKLKVDESSPFENGQTSWHGRINYSNKDKKKSGDIVFLLKEPSQMRGEVTALMGIPVATFVMSGSKFSLYLPSEGEVFSSTQGDLLVKKMTGLELSPHLLYQILSNRIPRDIDWKCNLGKNTDLPECQNAKNSLEIVWFRKTHDNQDFEFNRNETKVRINVNRKQPPKALEDSLFQIAK